MYGFQCYNEGMKHILICLEQLNAGGIETAVLTQAKILRERGDEVIVLAKPGIYSSALAKLGVKLIDYDFVLTNRYYTEDDFFIKIIQKHHIDEAHIHQYGCIPYLLPALLKLKVPYFAYIHSIFRDPYDWFMETYPIYRSAFPLFFRHAAKIISLTDDAVKYYRALFNLDATKYVTIHNSLDFTAYTPRPRTHQAVKNILIVSRLYQEKLSSFKTAFDALKSANLAVRVVGDGPLKAEMTEKYSQYDFVGETNAISQHLAWADLVFAVDRSALESLATRRLTIISSYGGNLILVCPETIKQLGRENFSGLNFTASDFDLDKVLQMSSAEYDKIAQSNYKYIQEHFDARKNLYAQSARFVEADDDDFMFEQFNRLESERTELIRTKEDLWRQHEKDIAYFEEQLAAKQAELDVLNQLPAVKIHQRFKRK